MNIKQKGQALVITLIILGVGSLVIVPTLDYVNTALLGIRVAKNALFTQYALDAAAEYQLWQLDYTDPGDLLEQPDDTIIVNGIEVEVGLDDPPYELPVPIVESGKYLEIGLESDPSCISLGYAGTITYTIKFYNCGTANIVASSGSAILPEGFEYLGDVTTDFPFTITEDMVTVSDDNPEYVGRQVVVFNLKYGDTPATDRKILPGMVGGEAPYKWIKFKATAASVGVGIFTAGAVGVTKDQGQKVIDDAAPIWSSIYYTKPHAGQKSISLVIKVNADGSVEVISYQTQ